MTPLRSPVQGTVVSVAVVPGDEVHAGQAVVVLESMKMEHVVAAGVAGTVAGVAVTVGQLVLAGDALATISVAAGAADAPGGPPAGGPGDDPDRVPAALAAVVERHAAGLDDRRPDAVARRRERGRRTARENIADLLDPGSFVEYAPLVVAAQRRRRTMEELVARTPADGVVGGVGTIDGRTVVAVSYDYTVLAGTQGYWGHEKKDRLFELAERQRLPVVLFVEGGGGRPGDTDSPGVTGLDCLAFNLFARLSGLVPLVSVVSGYCFAGNAALAGCSDVIIATEGSNLGMGGPAMIEGGGLGVFEPGAIGPMAVQAANGVVDLLVADDAAAVHAARRYLSYVTGAVAADWACADQRALRHAVPEHRARAYDVHAVLDLLCDVGSVLELRPAFAPAMVTALARVEGRAIGVVANNPMHLGGAIDATAADKAARFLQVCDAFDVPVLFLCDTPGFMVGPESEAAAAVRHVCRLFVAGANLSVPFATIVLRKGYGLGAQAMAGGSFRAPLFCVSWPSGEFGGMNLEGAVRLGHRRELDAIADPELRERAVQERADKMLEQGQALNVATHFEIDDVIDPADSRRWIVRLLHTSPAVPERSGKKRPYIEAW